MTVIVTAVTALISAGLGGWITLRAQDRLWRRDRQRQWRDIRLAAYTDHVNAVRAYVGYVLIPTTTITIVMRPIEPHDPMPFFDASGAVYRERLDATKTTLRLTADRSDTVRAANSMVRSARALAAARASHGLDSIPSERFTELWTAEREFVLHARAELGLANDFEIGDRPARAIAAGDRSAAALAAWVHEE
ncbi:hypothetical protein ACFVUS_29235 [Nocardia sp. NPDC058058]|uniref:hypothetical protein n=1 Tax=Nocardia sp. NPDC058058 TaxID=3346317 RepID=UPI0036DDB935